MSTGTLSDRDRQVRSAVVGQLEWDPAVDADAIGVSARDGAVVLTGSVPTYAGKLAAERAAKRVYGVRAVANDLEVAAGAGRTDAEIAADAAMILRVHEEVPASVQAGVKHGHVTLTGTVASHHQRIQAEKAIRHIRGVRHINDRITIVPAVSTPDMRRRIKEALHRNAALDSTRIDVAVTESVVHLRGKVTSCLQRQAAERASYDAPGVTLVDNQLVVEPIDRAQDDLC